MNAEQKQLARLRAWVDNLPSEVTLIHGDPFAETPSGVLVLHRQADAVLEEFSIERGGDDRLWEKLPSPAKARSLGVSDDTVIAMAESLHTALATIARLEGELAPVRTAQRMGSALVPVSPELLAEGAFTEQPLHVMLTDNGDGTHTITFRESEELRTLRTRSDAAERRVEAAVMAAIEATLQEVDRQKVPREAQCIDYSEILSTALAAASGAADGAATTRGATQKNVGLRVPYTALSANARGMEWRVPLWDAINALPEYSTAVSRQKSVVAVERSVELAMRIAIEEMLADSGDTATTEG